MENSADEECIQVTEEVKCLGRNLGLTEDEVKEIMCSVLEEMLVSQVNIKQVSKKKRHENANLKTVVCSLCLALVRGLWRTLKVSVIIIIVLLSVYLVLVCHNPTQKFMTRNTQHLIYPVMRSIRFVSLPLIKRFPHLTDWYEESCLIPNPFFRTPDLDCWPCQQVRSVLDLTGLQNFTDYYYHGGVPFIVKDVLDKEINFDVLQEMYMSHQGEMFKGAPRLKSSDFEISTAQELFSTNAGLELIKEETFHVEWKINRAAAARVVREVFKRPYFIPTNTEVSIQRYIYLDGPESSQYTLPLTEFANVWIAQGSGRRLILLLPSHECKRLCTVVSIILQPKDVLFYNWQFWRPKSLPIGYKNLSVTYVGSFY